MLARQFVDRLGDTLVVAEDEVFSLGKRERVFLEQRRQRNVGRQPQNEFGHDIAYVIAAVRDFRIPGPVLGCGPEPNFDPRPAIDGGQRPDQHHRMVDPAEHVEAGREVGDPDGAAVFVIQRGLHDRGVADVLLFRAREIHQFDLIETADGLRVVGHQQAAECRVAIELRHAGPVDGGALVDQGADLTIPDDGQVE
jgi:hypothetical protein